MLGILIGSSVAHAADPDPGKGTVTQTDGKVELLFHPTAKLETSDGVHVLFEGTYYLIKTAHAGDALEDGNVLRTAPDAKARVIFDNGDQLVVGSGTDFCFHYSASAADGRIPTSLDFKYGKVRGIIEKGGPRSRFSIRTRTAVMGVRGTDFWISSGNSSDTSELVVLRGAVEIKTVGPKPETHQVAAGFMSAFVPQAPLAVRPIAPADVAEVVRATHIEAQQAPAPEVAAAIASLENKAVQIAIKDIAATDPQFAESLKRNPASSLEQLNSEVVQHAAPEAPDAPKAKGIKSEPAADELKNVE